MRVQKALRFLRREREKRQEEALPYRWDHWARASQRPPLGEWRIWLILAGRGFGKTRTGAETIRFWVQQKLCQRIALIGETESETRQVMIEGPSGLLAVHPPSERPLYQRSRQQLFWSNGAVATCFSADAYEHLRGPQFDAAWIDELAKFKRVEELWDQLMFCLRLGKAPRAIVTTTPRPLKFLKDLINNPYVALTRGETFENSKNLAKPFLEYVRVQYEGCALGRQELKAEFVEDTPGSLWTRALLERARRAYRESPLRRLVIAIDPAVSYGEKSDETGIIAAGLTDQGMGVVLEDLSCKKSPILWAQRAVEAYHRLKADCILAEVNMGGALVEQLLRTIDPSIRYKALRASRGKMTRAEPVAALYEQDRIVHARPFEKLEDQLCHYVPGGGGASPDRLDALVWALTELMLSPSSERRAWVI